MKMKIHEGCKDIECIIVVNRFIDLIQLCFMFIDSYTTALAF